MKIILILSLVLCMPLARAGQCDETRNISEEYSLDGITSVAINALAGDLEIEPGEGPVRVNGTICTSRKQSLSQIDLEVQSDNGVLDITVLLPNGDAGFDTKATLDLIVTLPADLPVRVTDSSGEIKLSGVNVILVDDTSGSMRLARTRGNLEIADSSGDIEVRGHEGNIEITDSSGNLELDDLAGTVDIIRDSSGDIEIDTANRVVIRSDSSGEIDLRKVSGDVDIGSDSSGDIDIGDVGGKVTIASDGSGSIDASAVQGDFSVGTKGNGAIRTHDISGTIATPGD